jgi:uroporphyrinogen decarboxylase
MTFDCKATVIAAIKHRETPVCPYCFDLEPCVAERIDGYYGNDGWRKQRRNYIQRFGYDMGGAIESGPAVQRDAYGSVWRIDLRPAHLEEPALPNPSLKGYEFPEPDSLYPVNWVRQARDFLSTQSDCFTTVGIGWGLFERCWTLRGFENLLLDAAAEPEFLEDLAAAVAEHQSRLVDRLLDLPFDGIMFSDDWGDQRGVIIGPDRWRRIFKPHLARIYARVRAKGKFVLTHCCGSIVDIIPDVIEIGLDVLESVQPEAQGMNPYELKRQFGTRLTFWGGLGSQSIIPFGTPDQLRTEIRRLASEMKKGGGYILSCAKTLQPETPTENAAAIFEEFIAQGEKD